MRYGFENIIGSLSQVSSFIYSVKTDGVIIPNVTSGVALSLALINHRQAIMLLPLRWKLLQNYLLSKHKILSTFIPSYTML